VLPLTERIGGSVLGFLDDETLVIAGRLFENNGDEYTGLWLMDNNGRTISKTPLPSGGDTGYPGMILQPGRIMLSYYSSHEGKPAVYFAKVVY
jgi:hypothetical protein